MQQFSYLSYNYNTSKSELTEHNGQVRGHAFTYYVITKGEDGGFGMIIDYANAIFALSNAEFDYGGGRGSRNRQKVIT